MTSVRAARRRAGLLVPLFSCPSCASWGIGEIGDIGSMAAWLAGAGQRILQLLPVNEMAPGQQSPYSAISAMAIDPIFLSMRLVPEFVALGEEEALSAADRATLDEVRRAPAIQYQKVRTLKNVALAAAFERFLDAEWRRDTDRARALKGFLAGQAWWIEDYAIFRAVHAREGERPWTEWPEALRTCQPAAIDQARRELKREVLFYQYLQWLATAQWTDARGSAGGVELFGDLPFMVDGDSVDVWAHQHQFRFDASVGAPPDAFNADGQNWGVPVYRWDVVAREDFRWLRERGRRAADLYDGYRVDHVVGFYRTYARPKDGSKAFFTPPDEAAQIALGERVLAALRQAGTAEIIAEDLGTVPDFVRASLDRLGIPGFRVLRWERSWRSEGRPFRDPAGYPPVSVATSGTHDTETLAVWWEGATLDERQKIGEVPTLRRLTSGRDIAACAYEPVVRDALLEVLFASDSNLLLLPVQDVFGWRDRINDPASDSEQNWMFRLPWPCDLLHDVPLARERQTTLRAWATKHHRTP